MNIEHIKFIDKLYKNLYLDDSVIHHGSGNKYDKIDNIRSYMQKLEEIHDKVSANDRHIRLLKRMYYDKYIIKREDISDRFYKHQQEIALEQGYGYVKMTDEMKHEYQELIINDQKASLDVWIDYFLSEDAKVYPFWAKYWAFQGMLKIGNYDKEKETYTRRSKDTVAPFCDLNREALAISIDTVIKMFKLEKIDDEKLKTLVEGGSFPKIYLYVLKNIVSNTKNIAKNNNGKWIKYNKGSDHMTLVNSLRGYNTGWCTAGETVAQNQLAMGDFYVYYTSDKNGLYKIPRIAIRMEDHKIGEIRGCGVGQNIEPEMEQVVEAKIQKFPDKDKYYKKVNDMKLLTAIYKKHQKKQELTTEELIFLYEIYSKIKGFGFEVDPRINEIRSARNNIDDLNKIFQNVNRITKDLNLNFLTNGDGLVLPKSIGGKLNLCKLKSAKGLVLPQSVEGNLYLNSLKTAEGLVLPHTINGDLNLHDLRDANGLICPRAIGGTLYLNELTNAEGMVFPQSVGHSVMLYKLKSSEGVVLPQDVGWSLSINQLKSAKGLVLPQKVGTGLFLNSLETAEGLKLPLVIGGDLNLDGLTSVQNLKFPKKIDYNLHLNGLETAEGLILPEFIDGSLHLNGLKHTIGLTFPKNITGNLYLNGMKMAVTLDMNGFNNITSLPQNIGGNLEMIKLFVDVGLVMPQTVGGSLILSSMRLASDLRLPQTVGGSLILSSLHSVGNLILPQFVGEMIDLKELMVADKLVLPQELGCELYSRRYITMNKMDNIESFVFPENLNYSIYCNNFTIEPENANQYIKQQKK